MVLYAHLSLLENMPLYQPLMWCDMVLPNWALAFPTLGSLRYLEPLMASTSHWHHNLAWACVGNDDTRKNYNSFLVHDGSSWSATSAHGSQDEESRPEPSGKDEFQTSSSLAKPRPEPTRRWIVQTRHWTSHLSAIDKVDGNHCQRRLDELGQTIRCWKQLTYC